VNGKIRFIISFDIFDIFDIFSFLRHFCFSPVLFSLSFKDNFRHIPRGGSSILRNSVTPFYFITRLGIET
jgi:hypothetical protein